eukprot:scaffold3520_cov154-Isochrysis_galbana.AAC.5
MWPVYGLWACGVPLYLSICICICSVARSTKHAARARDAHIYTLSIRPGLATGRPAHSHSAGSALGSAGCRLSGRGRDPRLEAPTLAASAC